MTMLTNLIPSLIRTYVPLAVGALVAWLAADFHVALPAHAQSATITVATAAVAGLYYLGARLLEHKVPQAGWLLGSPVRPNYAGAVTALEDLGGVAFETVAEPADPNTAGASTPTVSAPVT